MFEVATLALPVKVVLGNIGFKKNVCGESDIIGYFEAELPDNSPGFLFCQIKISMDCGLLS